MSIKFTDRASILLDDVKTLTDGYKVVRSKIARTGIQGYLGREMGDEAIAAGHRADSVVRVYRAPEDVFSDAAVNGWAGVPVTKDHPPELVTPDNVKKYQVGDVRDRAHVDRATGWLGLEWVVRDADALAAFDSGEYAEVSGGYTAVIDWTPGVTPEGLHYDARQTSITPNHVAMVRRGRAFTADSADNWGASPIKLEDTKPMDMVKVLFGDKHVSVEAKDADTVAAVIKDHETKYAKLAAEKAVLDARVKELEEVDVDEEVDKRIVAREKRKAVDARMGDAAKDFTDAQIEVAHAMLAAIPDEKARKVIGDRSPVNVNDGVAAWDAIYKKDAK